MSTFLERSQRARLLAARNPATAEILAFYSGVAEWQSVHSGILCFDDLGDLLGSLVELTIQTGPEVLLQSGQALDPADFRHRLADRWEAPGRPQTPDEFFIRVLLELYAATLPEGLSCPWCAQPPALGCLTTQGDGLALHALCPLCHRRRGVVRDRCPACNEDDQKQLVTYSSPEFPHLRLRACDRCRKYLTVVDLEKDIAAIPEVDEMAGVSLDLWARRTGYEKIHPNIVGI